MKDTLGNAKFKWPEIEVFIEREQVDVTRDGSWGGPVDHSRKIIPGLTTVRLKINGSEFHLSPEQFAQEVYEWHQRLATRHVQQ